MKFHKAAFGALAEWAGEILAEVFGQYIFAIGYFCCIAKGRSPRSPPPPERERDDTSLVTSLSRAREKQKVME